MSGASTAPHGLGVHLLCSVVLASSMTISAPSPAAASANACVHAYVDQAGQRPTLDETACVPIPSPLLVMKCVAVGQMDAEPISNGPYFFGYYWTLTAEGTCLGPTGEQSALQATGFALKTPDSPYPPGTTSNSDPNGARLFVILTLTDAATHSVTDDYQFWHPAGPNVTGQVGGPTADSIAINAAYPCPCHVIAFEGPPLGSGAVQLVGGPASRGATTSPANFAFEFSR